MLIFSLLCLTALISFVCNNRKVDMWLLVFTASSHLCYTIFLAYTNPFSPYDLLGIDNLSRFFLFILSLLFAATALYSVDYLPRVQTGEQQKRYYTPFLILFLASMTGVILSNHLGLMWVFIEATTLFSTPLILLQKNRHSLEASWKYLFMCSVGIALAFIGILLLALASIRNTHSLVLLIPDLIKYSHTFNPVWLKISFCFILVGYGAKAGLAPMHTWLPDAHSQAPAPISALLSGTLLNCALLGILRFYQVLIGTPALKFAQNALLFTGLLSIFVCAVYILRIKDYKRMLAYSSMENMGIIAVGIALGGWGIYAALLHTFAHSLTKASLFLTSGSILRIYRSKEIDEIKGLFSRNRSLNISWLGGLLSLTAMPPFVTFLSELLIIATLLQQKNYFALFLLLALLVVILIGLTSAFLKMSLSRQPEKSPPYTPSWRTFCLTQVPALIFLFIVFVISFTLPGSTGTMLKNAAAILGGKL